MLTAVATVTRGTIVTALTMDDTKLAIKFSRGSLLKTSASAAFRLAYRSSKSLLANAVAGAMNDVTIPTPIADAVRSFAPTTAGEAATS